MRYFRRWRICVILDSEHGGELYDTGVSECLDMATTIIVIHTDLNLVATVGKEAGFLIHANNIPYTNVRRASPPPKEMVPEADEAMERAEGLHDAVGQNVRGLVGAS